MTVREQGFLLLTSFLGDPGRKPLTVPQFRKLATMAATMENPTAERDLTVEDLENYRLEGTDEKIPLFSELLDLYAAQERYGYIDC